MQQALALDIKGLTLGYEGNTAAVVRGVDLTVSQGEIVGLIGESGSGKSSLALACLRLLPKGAVVQAQSLTVCGHDVLAAEEDAMTSLRGGAVAMVFQDAMGALDPSMRIANQVAEVVRRHRRTTSASETRRITFELLERVGMPDVGRIARQYPHQLSGGLRQRAAVALALAGEPALLIADEPTTALDVTVQAGVLELFREIRNDLDVGILLVSHDIGVIAQTADRVAVMLDGVIVESGAVRDVLLRPRTDYTRMLVGSAPEIRPRAEDAPGTPPESVLDDALLDVTGVSKSYRSHGRVIHAVRDVSLQVRRGEVLGIVGESGSGKSTLAKMFVGLERPTSGSFTVRAPDASETSGRRRRVKRIIQMVFQHPAGSLNPRLRVGKAVSEPLMAAGRSRTEAATVVKNALDSVGLPHDSVKRFPDQFSGGQKQRIAIARAIAADPQIVILDEPTSALDVSVQAQILDLLERVRREKNFTYVFISHDLAVVQSISDRVAVMHSGRVVELAPAQVLFDSPAHWYTDALLRAVPSPDPRKRGAPPEAPRKLEGAEEPACAYALRCPGARRRCWSDMPELREISPGQQVACHFPMSTTLPVREAHDKEASAM